MNIRDTKTGFVVSEPEEKMEYLFANNTASNMSAQFLEKNEKIDIEKVRDVDHKEKCVIALSTQQGCPMKCKFCKIPSYGYYGNLTSEQIMYEVYSACKIANEKYDIKKTNRLNIHLARMGEPMMNFKNVFRFLSILKDDRGDTLYIKPKIIHPILTTMLPKMIDKNILRNNLIELIKFNDELKEEYDLIDMCSLQFSIHSTNEEKRNMMFENMSHSLEDISYILRDISKPKKRKYSLNFIFTQYMEIDVELLDKLFDKEKFIIKITPLHKNETTINNNINGDGFFEKVYELEKKLVIAGWDVLVISPTKEATDDKIPGGNLILEKG